MHPRRSFFRSVLGLAAGSAALSRMARGQQSAAARQPDQSDVLSAVHAPTLLATGDHDDNLPASRIMAERIRDAEFHLLPMCGHGSLFQRPDLFGDVLLAFIGRRLVAHAGKK